MAFEPEGVERLDVRCDTVDSRLACTVNNVVVIQEHDGTDVRSEVSGKEVVPVFKSAILRGRIAHVYLYEVRHGCTSTGTKLVGRVSGEDVARLREGEDRCPDVEHLFELSVHLGVHERGEACGCAHRLIEDDVDWETDQADFLF